LARAIRAKVPQALIQRNMVSCMSQRVLPADPRRRMRLGSQTTVSEGWGLRLWCGDLFHIVAARWKVRAPVDLRAGHAGKAKNDLWADCAGTAVEGG
jgi:hypothetical protein